jgi:hypothetical protein
MNLEISSGRRRFKFNRAATVAAFGLGLAFCACSSREKAPALWNTQSGTGGRAGTGGADTSGNSDASAGTGNAASTGSLDDLDPSEVYLMGQLNAIQGWNALAHLNTPNTYAIAFPDQFDQDNLQLLGSKLYYHDLADMNIWQFTPDVVKSNVLVDEYPSNMKDNDVQIDTHKCDEAGSSVANFATGPEGNFVYVCYSGPYWDQAGESVFEPDTGGHIVSLGYNHLALFTGSNYVVADLMKRESHLIDNISIISNVRTVRAIPDGFLVILKNDSAQFELWEVHADGTDVLKGTYPPLPDGIQDAYLDERMTADGTRYHFGTSGSGDVVLRSTIDGLSEIVYSEESSLVKVRVAELVTGP